jgi:hypothetical protein
MAFRLFQLVPTPTSLDWIAKAETRGEIFVEVDSLPTGRYVVQQDGESELIHVQVVRHANGSVHTTLGLEAEKQGTS